MSGGNYSLTPALITLIITTALSLLGDAVPLQAPFPPIYLYTPCLQQILDQESLLP